MRKLASGGITPDLTNRGCTLAAPASGQRAAAARQMPGRWCRTRSGASRYRRSLPWCPLAPAVSRPRRRQRTPEFMPGLGQLTRSVNCPVPGIRAAEPGTPATWQIKIINPPRRLRSPHGAYSWSGSGPICAMFARALREAANRANTDDRDPISPIVSWILPAIVSGISGPRAASCWDVRAAPQFPARKQGFAGLAGFEAGRALHPGSAGALAACGFCLYGKGRR
jgi:hypothetical protein